eukprot:m.72621 g.72621  ORF g.72621 m.72621 type:complete len:501 (-) comp24470_c0_seq2:132-1634(-)
MFRAVVMDADSECEPLHVKTDRTKDDSASMPSRPMFHAIMDMDSEREKCEPVPPVPPVIVVVSTANVSTSRPMFHTVVMDTDSEVEKCEPVPSPSFPSTVVTEIDTKHSRVSTSSLPMFHAVVVDADSEGEEYQPVPSSFPSTVAVGTNNTVSISRPMFQAVVMDTDSEGEECEPVPSPSLLSTVVAHTNNAKPNCLPVSTRPMFHAVVMVTDSEGEECEPIPSPSLQSTVMVGTNTARTSPSLTVAPPRSQPDAPSISLSSSQQPHAPHSPLLQRRGKPCLSVKIHSDRTDGIANGISNLLSQQIVNHTANLTGQLQLNIPNPICSTNTLRIVNTNERRPDRRCGLETARPPKRSPLPDNPPQIGVTPSTLARRCGLETARPPKRSPLPVIPPQTGVTTSTLAEIPVPEINRGACYLSLRDLEPCLATPPRRSQSDPLTPLPTSTLHLDVVQTQCAGLVNVPAQPRRGSWPRHKSHKQLPSPSFALIQEEETSADVDWI